MPSPGEQREGLQKPLGGWVGDGEEERLKMRKPFPHRVGEHELPDCRMQYSFDFRGFKLIVLKLCISN